MAGKNNKRNNRPHGTPSTPSTRPPHSKRVKEGEEAGDSPKEQVETTNRRPEVSMDWPSSGILTEETTFSMGKSQNPQPSSQPRQHNNKKQNKQQKKHQNQPTTTSLTTTADTVEAITAPPAQLEAGEKIPDSEFLTAIFGPKPSSVPGPGTSTNLAATLLDVNPTNTTPSKPTSPRQLSPVAVSVDRVLAAAQKPGVPPTVRRVTQTAATPSPANNVPTANLKPPPPSSNGVGMTLEEEEDNMLALGTRPMETSPTDITTTNNRPSDVPTLPPTRPPAKLKKDDTDEDDTDDDATTDSLRMIREYFGTLREGRDSNDLPKFISNVPGRVTKLVSTNPHKPVGFDGYRIFEGVTSVTFCTVVVNHEGADFQNRWRATKAVMQTFGTALSSFGFNPVLFPLTSRDRHEDPQKFPITTEEVSMYIGKGLFSKPGKHRLPILLGLSVPFDQTQKEAVQAHLSSLNIELYSQDLQLEHAADACWMMLSLPSMKRYPGWNAELEAILGIPVAVYFRRLFQYEAAQNTQQSTMFIQVESCHREYVMNFLGKLYSTTENRHFWPGSIYILPIPVPDKQREDLSTIGANEVNAKRHVSWLEGHNYTTDTAILKNALFTPIEELDGKNKNKRLYDLLMSVKATAQPNPKFDPLEMPVFAFVHEYGGNDNRGGNGVQYRFSPIQRKVAFRLVEGIVPWFRHHFPEAKQAEQYLFSSMALSAAEGRKWDPVTMMVISARQRLTENAQAIFDTAEGALFDLSHLEREPPQQGLNTDAFDDANTAMLGAMAVQGGIHDRFSGAVNKNIPKSSLRTIPTARDLRVSFDPSVNGNSNSTPALPSGAGETNSVGSERTTNSTRAAFANFKLEVEQERQATLAQLQALQAEVANLRGKRTDTPSTRTSKAGRKKAGGNQ